MTNQTPPSDRRPQRRVAILGVTAGLIGGGAIGLMATTPSFTSAASDDGTVALQDGAATTAEALATDDATADDTTADDATDPTDPTAEDAARERIAERVRERLQELVDAGTIDAGQADAVADHLAADARVRPGRGGGFPGHGHGPGRGAISEVVTEALGIEAEALRDELRAGNSIADVAAANDLDVQVVIDAMVAELSEKIDTAVADGRITAEDGADRLERGTARIEALVNGERPGRG